MSAADLHGFVIGSVTEHLCDHCDQPRSHPNHLSEATVSAPRWAVPSEPSERPVLHREAFYGLAGEVVEVLGPHTEADPVALLASFLVGFGSAVGPGPHAEADGSWHPARLFAVLVGRTSKARKGTSWRQIRRILQVADPGWVDTQVVGGLASGEGLAAKVNGSEDKRLLVMEEEYGRVLTVAAREGNTLSHVIRSAFDTGTLNVLTRKDPIAAAGAHVSVLAHVTEEELIGRLTNADIANGFGNRFLYLSVERSKLLPNGGVLPETEVMRLGRLTRERLQRARTFNLVRRSPDAEELWSELYYRMADDDAPGLLGSLHMLESDGSSHRAALGLWWG